MKKLETVSYTHLDVYKRQAYRIPNRPQGAITPAELAAGPVPTIPLGRMPVRSFLISPDGSSKLPQGLAITLRGVAFSGWSRVTKVEWSADNGRAWNPAQLGAESAVSYTHLDVYKRQLPMRPFAKRWS